LQRRRLLAELLTTDAVKKCFGGWSEILCEHS